MSATAASGMTERIGYRQVVLLLLLGCNAAIVGINHTLPTFQGYTPHYFCQVDNVSAAIEGCVTELNSSAAQSEPSCPRGYQFESDRGDWTVVTEWQLVCEDRFLSPMIATLYFCGVTLGAIVCGLLADRYGRRPLILVCLYAQGLLGVSLYFTGSLEAFMGLRFTQGFFVQGLQGTTYTLLMELFPAKFRTAVGVVLELYWALGLIYLAGASYYFPQWRVLQLILSIPTALTLLYVCLVPESARWLATSGRIEEAKKVWNRLLPGKKENATHDFMKRSSAVNFDGRNITTTTECDAQTNRSRVHIHVRDDSDDTGAENGTRRTEAGKGSSDGTHNNYVLQQQSCESEKLNGNVTHSDRCDYILVDNKNDNDKSDKRQNTKCNSSTAETTLKNNMGTNDSVREKTESVKRVSLNEDRKDETDCITTELGNCEGTREADKCEANPEGNFGVDSDGVNSQINNQLELSRSVSRSSSEEGVNYLWKQSVQELHSTKDNESISRHSSQETILRESDRDDTEIGSVVRANSATSVCDDEIKQRDAHHNRDACEVGLHVEDVVIFNKPAAKCKILGRSSVASGATVPDTTKNRTGIVQLFRRGVLRKYNFIMVFVWFSVSLSYYGITFHLPSLSGERHLNFLLGAILEAISYVLAYVILSRYGRRLPMASYLFISGIICIVIGAVSVVPKEDVEWIGYAQTALALLGKAAVVSGFCTMFIFTSELFPTVLRAAATGHCGFWGRVGSLLAPQLVFLGEYTLTTVPLAIMGLLGIVAGLLVLALPETLGQQLPDTVEDAEMLAKTKRQTLT